MHYRSVAVALIVAEVAMIAIFKEGDELF